MNEEKEFRETEETAETDERKETVAEGESEGTFKENETQPPQNRQTPPYSVAARTLYNGALQREVGRTVRICGIIITVCGGIILLGWLMMLIAEFFGKETSSEVLILFVGVFFLCYGIVLLVNGAKHARRADQLPHEEYYRFFGGFMIVTTVLRGEKTGQMKYYYGDFVKKRETAKYFMFYSTPYTAHIVQKSALLPQQLMFIRQVAGFPVK